MALNRVKQNASINASGGLVLGAALDGWGAIQFANGSAYWGAPYTLAFNGESRRFVPYSLTDVSGNYELGMVAFDSSGGEIPPRQIYESNLADGGFAASTVGLVFSVAPSANNSVAVNALPSNPDSPGDYSRGSSRAPRAEGPHSVSVGPGAITLGSHSVAVLGDAWGDNSVTVGGFAQGLNATAFGAKTSAHAHATVVGALSETQYAGESSIGVHTLPKKVKIPVATVVAPGATVSLTSADAVPVDFQWFAGPGKDRGECVRFAGLIFVRPASFSANNQVRIVRVGPGIFVKPDQSVTPGAAGVTVVSPTFTNEHLGASAPNVTFSFVVDAVEETTQIRVQSSAASNVLVTGILEVDILGITPGWDTYPSAYPLAPLPPNLVV